MRRNLVSGLAVVLAAAALFASAGAPGMTLEADGMRLAYHAVRTGSAAAAAVVLAAAAFVARGRRLPAGLLAVAAVAALLRAATLATWSLHADARQLTLGRLRGPAALAWADVAAVVHDPRGMTLTTRDGQALRVETAELTPADRAAFERSVARRVEEARERR